MLYVIITVILDIYLRLINLSNTLFIPLLFISSFPIIYKLLNKKYYFILLIIGIIYDLLFSNLIFLYVLIFLILGLITNILYKDNILSILFIFILNITLYYLLLFILSDIPITNLFIIYGSSFILNFIYLIISIFVLKKHNKKRLNY